MRFDLYHWLFDDPITAGSNAGLSTAETFHFLWPWLVFCCAGLLLTFYYSVEGRKRFVKTKPIIKRMLLGSLIGRDGGKGVSFDHMGIIRSIMTYTQRNIPYLH